MIPVRLQLRNFMCYTDVHEPLRFDGFQLACLSGQNGHGKSALLDAVTWALWGKSRARTSDELIHSSPTATEMEVEFEFLLDGCGYRVLRKRSRRGRGQTVLELAIRDGPDGAYRALTGNSVAETEGQIEQLLRMSYETFINSSFILQGRADSFTTCTPGQRKQVLSEILDLGYYDHLEERAREQVRARDEQRRALQQQIADDEAELEQEPALRERHDQLAKTLADLESALELSEARNEALRERVRRLQLSERELRDLQSRLADAQERADRQRKQLAASVAELERAEQIVRGESDIEQRYAELQLRRSELEQLTAVQAEFNRRAGEVARLEQLIAQARGQLQGRQAQLRGQLQTQEQSADIVARLEQEGAAILAELASLREEEAQREQLEARVAEARERYAALKASLQAQSEQLSQLRERKELLGSSSSCPVCRAQLDAERHRNLLAQYQAEEQAGISQRDLAAKQLEELERQGRALRTEIDRLGDLAQRRQASQERLGHVEQGLALALEKRRGAEELRLALSTVEREIEQGLFASDQQQDLVRKRAELAELGYDPGTHQQVSTAVSALSRYEALHHGVVEARRTLEREGEVRRASAQSLAEWESAILIYEQRRTELADELVGLAQAQAELAEAESLLRGQRLELGRLNQDLGAVRQHLATMVFTAQRRDERRADLARAFDERRLYQDLTLAFGKKGLQAMLIETAIPELEDEANELLGLMTDGSMRVSFETQRTARSGDTIETLDINISDGLGTRAYELFSGGEAFRVNFAVRIALSRLLAGRAGARLQLLVIDEGFGSQDAQGRERLVDAIKAIQYQFEKVLVITHLDDIKDLFPVRIEVVKTPAGSIIEMH